MHPIFIPKRLRCQFLGNWAAVLCINHIDNSPRSIMLHGASVPLCKAHLLVLPTLLNSLPMKPSWYLQCELHHSQLTWSQCGSLFKEKKPERTALFSTNTLAKPSPNLWQTALKRIIRGNKIPVMYICHWRRRNTSIKQMWSHFKLAHCVFMRMNS